MPDISNEKAFAEALSGLPLMQQRRLAARFIENVADLANAECVKRVQEVMAKSSVTAEQMLDAYQRVHAIYVATHPRSDLSELNFDKQAAHFVAEACLVCLAPTYDEIRTHHLAEKAAMYCRMARTCATLSHGEGFPGFADAEQAMRQEIQAQYRILSDFLASDRPS